MLEVEPEADAVIIDGSVLINAFPPKTSKTCDAYVQGDLIPKLESYGAKYSRTDIVFGVYKKLSLKAETRSKRGLYLCIRRRVLATSKTPVIWKGFLRDDSNKTELSEFLSGKVCRAETIRNLVIATKGNLAITESNNKSLDAISPYGHEEADTRLFLHAQASMEASPLSSRPMTLMCLS